MNPEELNARAERLLREAEVNAWKALSQGKYSGFGYWAAKSVQFRELLGRSHTPSPFAELREFAKSIRGSVPS